jgi:hypothetical protein
VCKRLLGFRGCRRRHGSCAVPVCTVEQGVSVARLPASGRVCITPSLLGSHRKSEYHMVRCPRPQGSLAKVSVVVLDWSTARITVGISLRIVLFSVIRRLAMFFEHNSNKKAGLEIRLV